MKLSISSILLFLSAYSFAQDENKPGEYIIPGKLVIICNGGWESDCSTPEEQFFIQLVDYSFYFSNTIGFNFQNGIKFEPDQKPEKISVKQRFIMAYGSRVSETEGVVFCDTSLSTLKGKNDNSWFSYTKFYPLMTDTAGFYIINDQTPNSGMYKSPRIGASTAKQHISKDHKWLFDTGTDQELRNNREVKVWPYAIELEFTSTYKGKSTVWKFRFRIRHGEC
jgi:hypothetical protein